MAAGLPVVASEIPGYMTVVRNGIEAMTFPPKDVGALVDALGKVLEDADLKRRLAGNALRRAEEFRWERVARRVLDYYVSCMNGVGRSREVPVSSTP